MVTDVRAAHLNLSELHAFVPVVVILLHHLDGESLMRWLLFSQGHNTMCESE